MNRIVIVEFNKMNKNIYASMFLALVLITQPQVNAGPSSSRSFSRSSSSSSRSTTSYSKPSGGSSGSSSGWGSSSKSTTAPSSSSSSGKSSGWGSSSSSSPSKSSFSDSSGSTSKITPNSSSSSSKSSGFSNSSDNNGWGNSTKSGLNSYKTPSATDTALQNKSIQKGTAYASRADAVDNFSSKYSSKYTSRYTSEPFFRPSHIPRSTYYNGSNYTVIYNSGYGGYGFYGPSGAWIAYDVMRDTIMLNALMNNNGYQYVDTGYPVAHRGLGFFGFLGIIMAVSVICALFWIVCTKM